MDKDEASRIIKAFKNSSPGWNSISSAVVKNTCHHFVEPLTHRFYASLLQGVFPTVLKKAKVIPISQGRDPSQLSNYRPVSVLPCFSKILKRLMYNRFLSFVIKHSLLYKYQFGFRKGYSTNFATITLIDKISPALDEGNYVLSIFLYLSKAFDTVNHSILCKKLEFYGIREIALDWIRNYLSDRSQYVEYNNDTSEMKTVTCGVPQGSMLGPLLFILYVNDIYLVSSCLYSIVFADDTNVFLSGNDPDVLSEIMNKELCKLFKWLKANKLSLNVKKTHYILFRSKHKSVPTMKTQVKIIRRM